jgi:hypothetical protein
MLSSLDGTPAKKKKRMRFGITKSDLLLFQAVCAAYDARQWLMRESRRRGEPR